MDVSTQTPEYIPITSAKVHDVNAMDFIKYEPNAFYIFDRAYNDFKRLYNITLHSSFFVTRAKSNVKFNRVYSSKVGKLLGEVFDQTGKLSGFCATKDYPQRLRK